MRIFIMYVSFEAGFSQIYVLGIGIKALVTLIILNKLKKLNERMNYGKAGLQKSIMYIEREV